MPHGTPGQAYAERRGIPLALADLVGAPRPTPECWPSTTARCDTRVGYLDGPNLCRIPERSAFPNSYLESHTRLGFAGEFPIAYLENMPTHTSETAGPSGLPPRVLVAPQPWEGFNAKTQPRSPTGCKDAPLCAGDKGLIPRRRPFAASAHPAGVAKSRAAVSGARRLIRRLPNRGEATCRDPRPCRAVMSGCQDKNLTEWIFCDFALSSLF